MIYYELMATQNCMDKAAQQSMKGGHYVISGQSPTILCS